MTCRGVRRALGFAGCAYWLTRGLALLAGSSACSGATQTADPAPASTAPVVPRSRVKRERPEPAVAVDLADRVAIFDRVSFASPSAIIHDPERDVYWVSNLNEESAQSGGFISRLDADGALTTLNFIDGRTAGVKLDAPRGLAVAGEYLFVADVTSIRKFRADNGEPAGAIEVPGAQYLSDVAGAADGSLYITDVGGDPNMAAVPEAGADAVYQIAPTGEVSEVARRPDLGGPFALVADQRGLWITCTGTNQLLLIVPSSDGTPAADAGRLDLTIAAPRGLVALPDGTFVIAGWSDGSVYRGFRDGPFERVISGLESPADLGYDARRKRLLIPLLTGHSLAIFNLPPVTHGNERPRPLDPSAP